MREIRRVGRAPDVAGVAVDVEDAGVAVVVRDAVDGDRADVAALPRIRERRRDAARCAADRAAENRRVVLAETGHRPRIRVGAQHDLIDERPVVALLNAQRVRTRRLEIDIRPEIAEAVVGPSPAADRSRCAVLQDELGAARRADAVGRRSERVKRVVELRRHRVVVERVCLRAHAHPHVIRHAGHRVERDLEVVRRRGQRGRDLRLAFVGIPQRVAARCRRIVEEAPQSDDIGRRHVGRPDHLGDGAGWRRRRRRRCAFCGETPHRPGVGHPRHRLRDDVPVVGRAWHQCGQRERLLRLRRVEVHGTEFQVRFEQRRVWIDAEVDVVDVREVSRIPLQRLPRRPEIDGGVGRQHVDRLVRLERNEPVGLDGADRIGVVPLPLEHLQEPVEHPRLEREVVVLLLQAGRRRREVRRAEHGQRTWRADGGLIVVEQHELLVVQAEMRANFQRDASRPESIEIVGVPLPLRRAVLVGVADQSDRDAALVRGDERVGLALVGDAIHDHVDLLQLLRIALENAQCVVLGLREIERAVLRIDRIDPRRRIRDVRVVSVVGGLDPVVVVLGHEALNDGQIVREVDDLVFVVDVVLLRHERGGAVIRAREFDDVLSGEQHHLPVEDAGCSGLAHAHRDAGRGQRREHLIVAGISGVRQRIDEDADGHAGPPPRDDRGLVARVLHEPERHVEPDCFVVDEVEERRPAILIGRVAQPFVRTLRDRLRVCACAGWQHEGRREQRCHPPRSSLEHEPDVLLHHSSIGMCDAYAGTLGMTTREIRPDFAHL